MKEQHLDMMIKRLYVNADWDYTNYACDTLIGGKRPFGNSSVADDVAEIIGLEKTETADGDEVYTKKDRQYCEELLKAFPAHLAKKLGCNII